MSSPAAALDELARTLRAEPSVVSPLVRDPGAIEPKLGLLVAAGPRAAGAPGEYAIVVESVREGYLLHYGQGRIVADADPDLALLAGDFLYALGLERLAALGDLGAVRELSDLISLAGQIHSEEPRAGVARGPAAALWLACVVAIAVGASDAHEAAKARLRAARPGAAEALCAVARRAAVEADIGEALGGAAEAIDCAADTSLGLG